MQAHGGGVSSTEVFGSVARNVRAARQRRGLSLEALAVRAGISKGILVALEQQRGNPSLSTLVRVADALGLPVSSLVETGEQEALRVVPAGSAPILWKGPAGGHGVLLAGSDPPAAAELWQWTLAPGEEQSSDAHFAGTRELVVVLDGAIDVTVDGHEAQLPPGAAAVLAGDRRHTYANRGTTPARYIAAIAVPPAADVEKPRTH
jgi:transcriptional regulator with XRE-family HTH domain